MSRNSTSAEQRQLAEDLIAHEATLRPSAVANGFGENAVLERLSRSLMPLVGKTGFCSLVGRALTLAQRDAEVLHSVKVKPDCTLDGYSSEAAQANHILISHIIELLKTFIGGTLTTRLLQNAWPELPALKQVPEGRTDYE
jgi:hypothetical protein